jgi:hypothetical protein
VSTDQLPPEPDGPSEKDRAAEVLDHAKRAVEFTEMPSPMWRSAEQEFFRSWRAAIQGAYDDAEESEHRRLAWERAEEAEELLMKIAEVVDDEWGEFHVARIRALLKESGVSS